MLRANPDCSVERAAERASLESLATAGSGVAVGNVYVYSLCCLSSLVGADSEAHIQ